VPDGGATFDAIRAVLDVDLAVVRLDVDPEEIERRLRSGIDPSRLEEDVGMAHDVAVFDPIDSMVIWNDGAPHVTARQVMQAIRWD
jgi:hypothetical protein